jgi:ATP-dependent Lon protease
MTNEQHAPDEPEVEIMPPGEEQENRAGHLVLARQSYPTQLPLVPVHQRPLFPKMQIPMVIGDDEHRKMIAQRVKDGSRLIGLVLVREGDREPGETLGRNDIYSVGVVAEVTEMVQPSPKLPLHIMISVLERFRIEQVLQEKPYMIAAVEYIAESDMDVNDELKAYSLAIIQSIKELIQLNPLHKEELNIFLTISSLDDPGRLADFSAALTTASGPELQEILETLSIRMRIKKVLELLKKEIDISRIQAKITRNIEEKMSQQQREFFLRRQLDEIKKELGLSKEGKETEIERFEKRIEELDLTEEARERISEEMEKFKLIEPHSPEFNVTRNYLDWLTGLPWGIRTEDEYDIHKAARTLDGDHYGLKDVKERILEFLAVGMMSGTMSGTILCFVGPPGVGKTSLGRSIASSIGRNFYRFSVGGIRDEAEIKGHRRTYIGALPGKFIQAVKTCKSANPVIMIDEIDKIGASFHGDPASALLEVLDPEQNVDFLDHYLDVRFDLSDVFFICTANQLDTIPRPLLDRMEVIKLAGYIMQEKLEIAKRFILPRQLKKHGVTRNKLLITVGALRRIIDGYAREPGVRGLENHIKKIIRKGVKELVEKRTERVRVEADDVETYLGKQPFTDERLYKEMVPGVVTGLAWTSLGGDTMYIEAAQIVARKPGFKQTGQLGNVMVESAEIAYTFIRSFLEQDEKAVEFFDRHFIHLHVPAGATPKDGPSAGITMATALYSLVKNKPVRKDLAMTGEISLTGLVMPIGGVKEKTLAAKRAKIKTLIFPSQNRKDFEELPEHIRKGLKVHYVSRFEDVLKRCF